MLSVKNRKLKVFTIDYSKPLLYICRGMHCIMTEWIIKKISVIVVRFNTKEYLFICFRAQTLVKGSLNEYVDKKQCAPGVFNLKQKLQLTILTYYNAKKVITIQENHSLIVFPLSYQLTNAGWSAHQGCLAGTD